MGPCSWFYDCGSLNIFCIYSMYICMFVCLFVYLGTVGPCFCFYDCGSLYIFCIYSMYICMFVCLYVCLLMHLPNPLAKATVRHIYLGAVGPCSWFYDCGPLYIFCIYSMYICMFVCLYVCCSCICLILWPKPLLDINIFRGCGPLFLLL